MDKEENTGKQCPIYHMKTYFMTNGLSVANTIQMSNEMSTKN